MKEPYPPIKKAIDDIFYSFFGVMNDIMYEDSGEIVQEMVRLRAAILTLAYVVYKRIGEL